MKNRTVETDRQFYAKIAGLTFLIYMVAGAAAVFLMNRATGADGTEATLRLVAEHSLNVRIAIVLELVESFSALVLGVTLYVITRDENQEFAMLAMVFRVGEGVLGAIGIPKTMELLSLANTRAGADAADIATRNTLGALLLLPVQTALIGAPFFAVGSLIFSWLLLRGHTIPVLLAGLGVFASALLVVGVPLQLADVLKGPLTGYMWLPMIVFQIPLGLWMLTKGVAPPTNREVAG